MGAVKERLAYDPWGKRRYADGSDDPTWSITSESNRGFTGHEQMDEVGLVNMNARLYDPEVGRFVSPDPYIQSAEDSQSYNRYAYARNNPLSYTDPSGNFFDPISFIITAIVAFAVSQLDFVQDIIQANPILGALIQVAFAAGGQWYYAALGAAAVTSAQGGDIGDIIKSAAIAAATAGAFEKIGGLKDTGKIGFGGQVALHTAVGCASAAAGGGKCAAGAASAGFSVAVGSIIPEDWTFEEGLVPHAVIGGVAAELGGGKFANGAVTSSFGYIYNRFKHPRKPTPAPDADGVIEWHEANKHYREGSGRTLHADLSKIDLSEVSASEFKGIGTELYVRLDGKHFSSPNDAVVYGTFRLTLGPNNTVTSGFDTYDFDIKPWSSPRLIVRNIATIGGRYLAGGGKKLPQPFRIEFYGSGKINP